MISLCGLFDMYAFYVEATPFLIFLCVLLDSYAFLCENPWARAHGPRAHWAQGPLGPGPIGPRAHWAQGQLGLGPHGAWARSRAPRPV